MSDIVEKINQIQQQIPSSTRLIAVSKTVSPDAMRQAYTAGIRDFGESKIQEAMEKKEQLKDLKDVSWHFIGHLQTNKVKPALEHFQWIHSIDSLKLAKRLNKLIADQEHSFGSFHPPQLCLQVKMLPDPNKYGWNPSELLADLPQLEECQYLKIKGLMTILPLGLSDLEKINAFHQTYQLAQQIKQQHQYHLNLEQLSMGMSGDYLLAVKSGATMVRLGRIIFGERK